MLPVGDATSPPRGSSLLAFPGLESVIQSTGRNLSSVVFLFFPALESGEGVGKVAEYQIQAGQEVPGVRGPDRSNVSSAQDCEASACPRLGVRCPEEDHVELPGTRRLSVLAPASSVGTEHRLPSSWPAWLHVALRVYYFCKALMFLAYGLPR